MTIGHLIQSASSRLERKNVNRLDVELLLSQVLSCERMYLYSHWNSKMNKKQIKQFHSLLKIRQAGMPMAYICQKKEFYGYEFVVKPGVFIPRPETETLVSAVLTQGNSQKELNIMDFGCGSGCVGLSLLACFPRANLIAIDLKKEALEVSRINADNMGVADRAVFLCVNVSELSRIKKRVKKQMDIIVANPPYIAFNDSRIEKEVVSFEPPEALFSFEEGRYHILSWLKIASQFLRPGGSYFFEIGARQDIDFLTSKVNKMNKKAEFQDMSHVVRVVQFQKCNG